ncbi:MAG TPA: hypothetical protein VE978_04580 [Chitinophagales bacterium]|nr:hypothetical protein [Chitinophagales bacterium]
MEVFVDGGLFELLLAVAFGYAINFIFLKRYLLVIFSGLCILTPVALIFLGRGELYYWLISICILNSIFLVILLWRERQRVPNQPLFDVEKFKRKFFRKKTGKTF